ncbi:MAG: hypothetical protein HFJ27_01765 [Clostridia bacterium]|nr:hypothetical protein [Clostridia bacterium]
MQKILAELDGSNYPKCEQDLGRVIRELVNSHPDKKEISVNISGISHQNAISFGYSHAFGHQSFLFPIRDSSETITGWTLQLVKYQLQEQRSMQPL